MLPISSCSFSQILVWMLFTVVHRPLFCLQPTESAPPQWSFVSYPWRQDSSPHGSVTLIYCLSRCLRVDLNNCLTWLQEYCQKVSPYWMSWCQMLVFLSMLPRFVNSFSNHLKFFVWFGYCFSWWKESFSKPNKGESLDQTSLDYSKPWWSYHSWDICSLLLAERSYNCAVYVEDLRRKICLSP